MTQNLDDVNALAANLEQAYSTGDLKKVAPLFAQDIQWGDEDLPQKCRGRPEVVAMFSRLMARGVTADMTEVRAGTRGVLIGLSVRSPDQAAVRDRVLFHVYLVRGGQIVEIRRYDDRRSAARTAGVSG